MIGGIKRAQLCDNHIVYMIYMVKKMPRINSLYRVRLKTFLSVILLSGSFLPLLLPRANAVEATPPVIQPDAPGTASLNIGWLQVTGLNQVFPAGQTSLSISYKTNGTEVTTSVPVAADTYLLKDSTNPMGSAKGLLLRDNRFSQVLIKLNLTDLPKDAQIEKASLQFKISGLENKQQAGTFNCFLVKTPWTENATWVKPDTDAEAWNGLRSGKDFDPAAFTTVTIPSLDDKQKGGQIVEIPGFEGIVQQWLSGAVANEGFLLTFSGKAMQLSLPAREEMDATRTLQLGGAKDGKVLLSPNLPLFDRILMKPDDILNAQLSVSIAKALPKVTQGSTAELKIYEVENGSATAPSLLGSVPIKNLPATGSFDLLDLAPELKKNLAGPHDAKQSFLLTIEGGTGASPEIEIFGMMDRKQMPSISLVLHDYPAAQLFGDVPVQPQPGVYTKVVDGHLNYGGKRLRLWGVVGYPHVDRLVKMGFNAQRVWEPSTQGIDKGTGVYSVESAKKGEFLTYQKGDGSRLDLADKHMADLKEHHFFVMFGGLVGTIPYTSLLTDDSFVAGGDDWSQWKEAMSQKDAGDPIHYIFVDERLQKIRKTHAKNLLTHVNLYTGKAYGEEENIAIYEVFNENGFVAKVLGGELAKWPPYFKNKLQKRWNQWLSTRYQDDDGVKKAWGSLKDGESLVQGTIAPAPVFDERANFPEKRADDFVEFMIDLENQFNQDFRSYCRSLFPTGVGVNVVPFSFDTFYRPNLQWAYTQNLGDVHSQGMYFWDLKSSLEKPPAAYVIDSYTPINQPTVLYETNAARPNPFRGEYPLKAAALASYEDWDGVFWHYWGPVESEHDVAYLASTLQLPNISHYWAAVIHENDPVMCTAMALGGRIFLGNRLPPAKDPDVFKIGKQALFSYSAFRGIDVADSTFSKGSKILYAPKEDSGVTLNGKPVPAGGRIEKAVAAGDFVTWDWPNGRLIIDAPTVKAYVGRIDGSFRFSDGITLGNVSTPWIIFSMSSSDGKPLTGPDATKRILMDGVFDARNSGMDFDFNVLGGPLDQARSMRNPGHAPTLVDKVEYKVWFPNQLNGTLKSYDFALREIKSTGIDGSNEVSQQGPTPYMDALEINSWGASGQLPVAQATIIEKQDASLSSQAVNPTSTGGAAAVSGATFPIPGVDWSTDYPKAHRYLEDSTLVFTSISKFDPHPGTDESITLTGAQLSSLWNSLADIVLTFTKGKMTKVEVTFKQPPPVDEVITDFSKVLGAPDEKKLEAQYGTTEIHWTSKAGAPDVFVTESQGQMKIIYQAPSPSK